MKPVLLAVILSATLAAESAVAAELYCQGDAWLKIGEPVKHSMLLSLDKGSASAQTFSGAATGEIEVDSQLYKGTLHTASGRSYWMTIDRYSGELHLSIPAESRAEFVGVCAQREPRF
jgi:hypothetical protein